MEKQELEFELNNDKKCKLKAIWDSKVNTNIVAINLFVLHYLISSKDYNKSKNTCELALAIMHSRKIISFFLPRISKKANSYFSPSKLFSIYNPTFH